MADISVPMAPSEDDDDLHSAGAVPLIDEPKSLGDLGNSLSPSQHERSMCF